MTLDGRSKRKPLTREQAEKEGYIYRNKLDEKNHQAHWEALEKIQDWDEIPETYSPLQENILFTLQQHIDSDGGIIDRVGSERPKQVLYCRMYMHLNRLAIRKLKSTIKSLPEEVEDGDASQERNKVSKV